MAMFNYYTDDSLVCIITDAISNPESTKEDRKMALIQLRKHLEGQAKDKGCKVVLAMSAYNSIQENLVEGGYTLTNQNLKQYIKGLN